MDKIDFYSEAMYINNNIICPICDSNIVFLGHLIERNKKQFLMFHQIDCRNYHYHKNTLCKIILIEKNHKEFDTELINQFKQIVDGSKLKFLGFKL